MYAGSPRGERIRLFISRGHRNDGGNRQQQQKVQSNHWWDISLLGLQCNLDRMDVGGRARDAELLGRQLIPRYATTTPVLVD